LDRKIVAVYFLLLLSSVGLIAATLTSNDGLSLFWFGLTGLSLGLRHGLDADHLAMIDNITRKLGNDKRENSFVGGFFSIGHGITITVVASIIIVIANAFSPYESFLQIFGIAVSAGLLYFIATINIFILLDLLRTWKRKETITIREVESGKGVYATIYRKLSKLISRQWQMVFVGLLFGVAFDTVTEVGALSISALLAHSPFYAMIPVLLFNLGVVGADSTDGFVMKRAYAWSMAEPLKRLLYNINLTASSVIIALGVGTLEILQLTLGLFSGVSFTSLGFLIVATLLGIWGFSYRQYRIRSRRI
jgi:high-affinity nickel-transport protein